MKTANLVVAIIYTAFLALILLAAEDTETIIGVFMLAVPVVMNWISYVNWPKK
jgi:hypothetical protein